MKGPNIPKELQAAAPLPEVRVRVLVDDIAAALPPEPIFDTKAIAKIVRWVPVRLVKGGIMRCRSMQKVLFPGGLDERPRSRSACRGGAGGTQSRWGGDEDDRDEDRNP